MGIGGWTAWFCGLAMFLVCQGAALAATVELKGDERGHFMTRAAIDNTDIDVIIDTGASTVVLSQEDAERVGLHPGKLDYVFPVATANGIVKCAPATLRRVEVGTILIRDVQALVLPRGAFEGTLLGMSFLGRLKGFRVRDGVLLLEK
jgi:aspartyl protease family protein